MVGSGSICVRSDVTVSIGSFKPGHFLNMAKDVIKQKINCDIGIRPIQKPYYLITAEDIKPYFTERPNFSNKGTYGYTAIIGGSRKYSGALRLAAMANAAMRSGAGVVKAGLPNSLYHDLLPLILESTVSPLTDNDGELVFVEEEIKSLISNVKTVAFGMGIGISPEISKCLEYLLKEYTDTLIVDADGLNVLSKLDRELLRRAQGKVVLTPHIKEFERLTGLSKEEILSNPVKHAEDYALDAGVVLLLKGPSTIVTDGVRTYIVDAGCAGMATAGSGDVLSGILSAVCSFMPELISYVNNKNIPDHTLATAIAAFINGKAGELAQQKTNSISMIAGDTVSCIPEVISGLIYNSDI
jgi:NAD(P)H-hydrate epimerase